MAEMKADMDKVFSLLPGKQRLSLHAIYGDFGGEKVDRDQIEMDEPWGKAVSAPTRAPHSQRGAAWMANKLSISERQELCQTDCMFCLDVRDVGVGFETNLDAVARSGVRVNPRVLQLARRKGGA